MARGVTTTVTVNGRVEKRASERTYTHATLVLRDGNKRKAEVEAPFAGKELKDQQAAWQNILQYVGGEWVPHPDPAWAKDGWLQSVDRIDRFCSGRRPVQVKADTKAYYEQLAKDGFDAWLASEHAKRLEGFHNDAKKGRYLWHVLGWSASERNAAKRSELAYYDQHKVVPVGTVIELPGDYSE